jgi:tRNA G18 (ribose-2'-O)-methylase SpoU
LLIAESGKTTALIYKMRAVNESLAINECEGVRQLFVTRSRVLAQHVESSYRGLVDSMDIASKSKAELEAMAEHIRQNPHRALVEFDNEVDLRDDLPSRFSWLQDSHFPLFISFDKVSVI